MSLDKILGSRAKVKSLEMMFTDASAAWSMFAVSSATGIAYSAVHRSFPELEKEGIIKRVGRDYVLNKKSEYFAPLAKLFGAKAQPKKKRAFKAKNGIILIHHNADPDALGSAIGLARGLSQSGLKLDVAAPAGLSKQSKNVLLKYPYPVIEDKKEIQERIDKSNDDHVVFVVDTSSPEQLGGIKIPDGTKMIILDHHEPGKLAGKATLKLIDPTARSSAVLVFDMLKNSGIEMTKEIATFLLLGMIADTGFFRMAEKRDMAAVVELLDHTDIRTANTALQVKEDPSERLAKAKAFKRLEIFKIGDKIAAFAKVGSYEASAARSLTASFADMSFVANPRKGDARISARGRPYLKGKVDLSKILKVVEKHIDGSAGGHDLAASANGKNSEGLVEARKAIVKALEKKFGEKAEKI